MSMKTSMPGSRNLAVFTTKQWLDLGKPILHVVHDRNGHWQFLTGDQLAEDIAVVAPEQMTRRDPTLNAVFDLDYGQTATRSDIGGKGARSASE